MSNSKQETTIVSNQKTPLGWSTRIILSLFSATGIGTALGTLLSMSAKGVDGEAGYAALVYIPVMMFFTFLALIFITNKRVHIIFAIISALIWAAITISNM